MTFETYSRWHGIEIYLEGSRTRKRRIFIVFETGT